MPKFVKWKETLERVDAIRGVTWPGDAEGSSGGGDQSATGMRALAGLTD